MKLTKHQALKKSCYWTIIDGICVESDFTGPVYMDANGFWLKTPTGFTKVNESDFVEN
ncbi:hypothetical protein VmeM32_00169 [Vibrio phage vB_VmeM-32]|nr:hypothetical protein VmeM32_00169 [Vibrio phage vB_VmeM-32]